MAFSKAVAFGKNLQKRVLTTFAAAMANTGQTFNTISGTTSVTGGVLNVSSSPALVAVSKGMGEPDFSAELRYEATTTLSNAPAGVAFWGTSATGGTWMSAYPTTSFSSSTNYQYRCSTSATVACGGSSVNCVAGSSRQSCGNYGTATCTPSGKGASCSVSCSNYTSNCSSGANQTLVASSPCGSASFTSSAGGQWATRRCCFSNADTTSCSGAYSYCYTAGCTPSGCCNSVTNLSSTTTTYVRQVRIGSGSPTPSGYVYTSSVSSSTSGYPAVGSIVVSASGSTVTTRLYSDTAATSQLGSSVVVDLSGYTRGDFVGIYAADNIPTSAGRPDRFTVES